MTMTPTKPMMTMMTMTKPSSHHLDPSCAEIAGQAQGPAYTTESQPAETHTGQPVVQGIPTGSATEQPPNGMPQATSAPELAATRRTTKCVKGNGSCSATKPGGT